MSASLQVAEVKKDFSDLVGDIGEVSFTPSGGSSTDVQGVLDKAYTSLNSTSALSASVFNKQANIYNVNEPGVGVAALCVRYTSNGIHTDARYGDHAELVAEGSGSESGPQRADFAFSRSIFKKDFPSVDCVDGEINPVNLAYRQSNGDSCHILGNGVIRNGFGAFSEANINVIDPVTFEFVQSINMQDAVCNDRDGGYFGSVRQKNKGAGGTGTYVSSDPTEPTASWDYGFRYFHKGKEQLVQRTSDASLLHYKFGDVTDFTKIVNDGGLKLYTGDGDLYNDLMSRPITYTPTFTADSGTVSVTINNCFYVIQGKRIEVFFDIIMDTYVGAGSNLRISTPLPVKTGSYFGGSGHNASTGQALTLGIVPGTNFIQVRRFDGAFPANNGAILSGSISYIRN